MSDVKWIKIDVSMFEDEKIDFICSLPEADSIIIIWLRLLTMAGKSNAKGYIMLTENIPYTEEMIANRCKKPILTVKLAIETFKRLGMIESDEKGMFLVNWGKHQNIEDLEKIREQNKLRKQRQRDKEKRLLSAPDMSRDMSQKVT